MNYNKKISFLNRYLLKDYFYILSFITIPISLFSPFCNIPKDINNLCFYYFFGIIILIYIILLIRANTIKSMKLKVRNVTFKILTGNLFSSKDSFKVIPCNEYFDTDKSVVSDKTLHGNFLKDFLKNKKTVQNFDNNLSKTLKCSLIERNNKRKFGKNLKYKLGSIYKYNDFLLTAFSKFDETDCAKISLSELFNFYINFWNELSKNYNGKDVSIPLLGSGITRFFDCPKLSDQDLLEILLLTFKYSSAQFSDKITFYITILPDNSNKINLYLLKQIFN